MFLLTKYYKNSKNKLIEVFNLVKNDIFATSNIKMKL